MNINVREGKNELSKRDHLTMVFHYGQIDRWATYEKGDVVINSDNADNIKEGQKVKISETLFMKWMKLTTMVDRSNTRKEDYHVKNKVSTIAKMLGYSNTKGLYKILKPLFEVGLIDMKETTVGTSKMIDIVVYPYPVYAESQICELVKVRSWNDRESFGFSLSFSGVEAKKNVQKYDGEKKSTQGSEQKYTGNENKSTQALEQKYTGVENKSTQGVVYKSTQGVVYFCTQPITNINKSTNKNKSSNINKSLIGKLSPKIRTSFVQFVEKENIAEQDLKTLIDRLIGFNPNSSKFSSHEKYYTKTLQSIRDEKAERQDSLPKWASTEPESKPMTEEEQEAFELQKREFEEMLARDK